MAITLFPRCSALKNLTIVGKQVIEVGINRCTRRAQLFCFCPFANAQELITKISGGLQIPDAIAYRYHPLWLADLITQAASLNGLLDNLFTRMKL
nr:hypothetical protein [Erwinia rhapontici]